jgi:hypothetical protein
MKGRRESKARPATRVSICKFKGRKASLENALVRLPGVSEDLLEHPDPKGPPDPRARPVPAEVF